MVLGTKPTFAVLSLVSVMAFVLSLDVIATATMASTFILHGRFNQIAENAYQSLNTSLSLRGGRFWFLYFASWVW